MNVELLQKVKRHILEEPNRLMMGDWIKRLAPGTKTFDAAGDKYEEDGNIIVPARGTVACIAGWTVLLSEGMDFKGTAICERAASLLGIEDSYDLLFYVDNWDDAYIERWEDAKTPDERARVVADVIDNFIGPTITSLEAKLLDDIDTKLAVLPSLAP